MKKILALAVLAALVPHAALAAKAKPVTVFEDATGDAGNQDSGIPGFDQAGFDLVSGSIVRKGKNIEFTVNHSAMPPTGTIGEAFRFMWHFSVDGEQYRFTVKSLDIGKPDVIAMSGTERIGQVYTNGVYRLEQCTEVPGVGVNLINCTVLEYLEGAFDPASQSVTWALPMKTVKAKPGSAIAGGTSGAAGSGCQICWVPHYLERSLTATTIIDSAAQAVEYKVPK